jgi:hypothetical protein
MLHKAMNSTIIPGLAVEIPMIHGELLLLYTYPALP